MEQKNKNDFDTLMYKFIKKAIDLYDSDVTLDQLMSRSRKRKIKDLRHIILSVSYLLNKNKNISQTKIGSYFKMDHSSVAHSVMKSDHFCVYDKGFKVNYDKIYCHGKAVFKNVPLKKDVIKHILDIAFPDDIKSKTEWLIKYNKAI